MFIPPTLYVPNPLLDDQHHYPLPSSRFLSSRAKSWPFIPLPRLLRPLPSPALSLYSPDQHLALALSANALGSSSMPSTLFQQGGLLSDLFPFTIIKGSMRAPFTATRLLQWAIDRTIHVCGACIGHTAQQSTSVELVDGKETTNINSSNQPEKLRVDYDIPIPPSALNPPQTSQEWATLIGMDSDSSYLQESIPMVYDELVKPYLSDMKKRNRHHFHCLNQSKLGGNHSMAGDCDIASLSKALSGLLVAVQWRIHMLAGTPLNFNHVPNLQGVRSLALTLTDILNGIKKLRSEGIRSDSLSHSDKRGSSASNDSTHDNSIDGIDHLPKWSGGQGENTRISRISRLGKGSPQLAQEIILLQLDRIIDSKYDPRPCPSEEMRQLSSSSSAISKANTTDDKTISSSEVPLVQSSIKEDSLSMYVIHLLQANAITNELSLGERGHGMTPHSQVSYRFIR